MCFEARLIVECDGGQHVDSESDARRDAWFVRNDFRVLRFWNHDVLQATDAVLTRIFEALHQRNRPPP